MVARYGQKKRKDLLADAGIIRNRLKIEAAVQNAKASKAGNDSLGEKGRMIPLHEDPYFTFRFADDRIIPRFHLEGVEAGQRVSVFKIDPGSGERMGLLTTAAVGESGWVDLPEPLIIRAGEAFLVVPVQNADRT